MVLLVWFWRIAKELLHNFARIMYVLSQKTDQYEGLDKKTQL